MRPVYTRYNVMISTTTTATYIHTYIHTYIIIIIIIRLQSVSTAMVISLFVRIMIMVTNLIAIRAPQYIRGTALYKKAMK